MAIEIPNTCNSFLETVGCCWHFECDIKDIADVKGTKVASADLADCKAYCRSVIERGRLGRRKIDLVHAHVELASIRLFPDERPVPSSTMDDIASRLTAVLHGKKFTSSSVMSGFKIPIEQVAGGSALSAVLGFQGKVASDHRTLLTRGTLSLLGDSGHDDTPIDTLTIELATKDDKAYLRITVEGAGESEYFPNCLAKAASRLTAVFDKMVLAKEHPVANEES